MIRFHAGTGYTWYMYARFKCIFSRFITIAFCLCLPINYPVLADDEQEEALEEVREKINELRREIESTQTLHDSVRTKLREVERDISKLHRGLKKLEKREKKQKRALTRLYNNRKNLKQDLKTHHRLLARQVQAAYMIGEQEYLKLILNQEDPSSVGRTMTYYQYFNRARLSGIETARKTLIKLNKVEKEIVAETKLLKKLKQQQLGKQNELRKVSRVHAIVVTRLRDKLVNKEQVLSQLVEDEQRLYKLITQLDEVIPDILTAPGKRTPFANLRGELKWPTIGSVQALFGKQRRVGNLKWKGIIIKAKEGREIRAISHGRVAYADWLRGYGLLLILDHGNGYMSLYGHNQSIYKETGEWVEAGEAIASVGKSGGQKQAGLYFEIRHNGRPKNPIRWCRRG